MKRLLKISCFALLLCLLITVPFGPSPSAPNCRYVYRAEVNLYRGDQHYTTVYLQPQKIHSLLNYLRSIRPRGRVYSAPADPNSHHYRIDLYFSDGSQSSCHLQDYRYFRKNNGLWQRVNSPRAQMLYPLLLLLHSDA